MADTQQTIAALKALLVANTAGDIGGQDMLDIVETLRNGHGELSITSTAATVFANTTDYVDVAGTFTLSGNAHNWDMNTNGQLRYIGTADRIVHVAITVSLTGSNNQTLNLRAAKTGVSNVASEIDVRIGTGADVASFALHAFDDVTLNDYWTLEIRNTTGTNDVTAETLNYFVMDMAK